MRQNPSLLSPSKERLILDGAALKASEGNLNIEEYSFQKRNSIASSNIKAYNTLEHPSNPSSRRLGLHKESSSLVPAMGVTS